MNYDLWIAGTQVTSENCNDISNFDGVSGRVRYNPDTNTLTLDNATITHQYEISYNSGYYTCIYTSIRNLTIIVRGNCEISCDIGELPSRAAARLKYIVAVMIVPLVVSPFGQERDSLLRTAR